jgi:HlyD family secretion protein
MKSFVRRLLLFTFIAGLAGAIAFGLRPTPVEVDLAPVVRGEIRETVDQDGKTRLRERYVVSSPLDGRLARIGLDPGDKVEAGETVLASIEPQPAELLDARTRQQAEANVRAAEARVERTEPLVEEALANLDFAQADLARARQARAHNAQSVAEIELENKEMLLRTRQALVRSARYAQDIAKFELDQARAALVRSTPQPELAEGDGQAPPAPYPKPDEAWRFTIASPINGAVLRVIEESATIVTPGAPLVEVGDPTDLEVVIDVLSREAVRIAPGNLVLLEDWGGEKPLNGAVRLVEPSGFTKISTLGVEEQRVNVIVDLVDPLPERHGLGDGFRVDARIVVAQVADALKAPASALFRVGKDWAVFRVDQGVARQRIVKLGLQNGLEAEVLEGLAEGDLLVSHPGDNITDGQTVASR